MNVSQRRFNVLLSNCIAGMQEVRNDCPLEKLGVAFCQVMYQYMLVDQKSQRAYETILEFSRVS